MRAHHHSLLAPGFESLASPTVNPDGRQGSSLCGAVLQSLMCIWLILMYVRVLKCDVRVIPSLQPAPRCSGDIFLTSNFVNKTFLKDTLLQLQ